MIPKISSFANLPTPAKVVLLAVSGGGIVAIMRYILPRQLFWIVFIGLAVVALLLLVYWRLLKWWKKRQAAPMERGVIENTSATPQGITEAAHVARLDDLRKKFEDGIAKFHAAGKSLYNFPWYIIVGEPGSGKTEAIRHCNVGFPPGLQDQFQGAGGTLNMNWWFTDHAVILDTAGRLMFEEVETGGSSEWKEFLSLLKRYRPRCPVNGVFLVIPADSLIKDTADDIEKKASKIARQFDVIQRTLDVRFPVFIVATKSDLINGFRDFFDNLTDPQLQHQILGWSNPAPLDEPYNTDFVDQHLKMIRARLFRRRLALLQEMVSDEYGEPRFDKMRTPDTLYAFPQSLTRIAPRMARYLELIFSVGSRWSCKPLFFRGIYFTSSMREGSALDEDLAESLGVPVDSLPDGRVWERERAYFLRDLFIKKVFREKGLVTYATNAKKLHGRRKAAILLAAAASVVLLLFFTFYGANRFSRSIGELKYYLGVPDKLAAQPGKPNELTIVKRESEDQYRYIGRAGIPGMPEDVKRFVFPAMLVDAAAKWEEKGIPWVFAPAAKFARGITPQKLKKVQAAAFEFSVLWPLVNAASDIMDSQVDGNWTRRDPEAMALAQLIRIKANKPMNEEGEYSPRTLLDPFFAYVLRRAEGETEEDFEMRIRMCSEDKPTLHRPLAAAYDGAWPPSSLKTDPNLPDPAIEQGVKLFIEYWTDPNRSGTRSPQYAQVETIMKLRDALEKFAAAEERLLSLGPRFDPKSNKSYVDEQWQESLSYWNESFAGLAQARTDISNYAATLKNPASLSETWSAAAEVALRDVSENYDYLLRELDPNEIESEHFLGRVRERLEKSRQAVVEKLRKRDFEERLKLLDQRLYAKLKGGSHLYQTRFEMYSSANGQLGTARAVAGIDQVHKAFGDVREAAKEAELRIDGLLNLDPAAFHFQEAADISKAVLLSSEQRQIYSIVKQGLEGAPKTVQELGAFIEKNSNWDWTGIPPEIIERKYDPNITVAALKSWKVIGDALTDVSNQHDLPEETRLLGTYRDATGTYTGYAKLFLDQYWLGSVPEHLIGTKVTRDSSQLGDLIIRNVFDELLTDVGEPLERVLDRSGGKPLYDSQRAKQFGASLNKIKEGNQYDRIYRACRSALNNWRKLSTNVFEARRTLLSAQAAVFREDYTPFAYESPAQFVDMYWTELTLEALRKLADQVQSEGTRALDRLRTQYGSKFPLARDSGIYLTQEEFIDVRSLLNKVSPEKDWEKTTVGAGAATGLAGADSQLERLRSPAPPDKWVDTIYQLFQSLPKGGDPYYCRMTLLSEKQQRRLLPEGQELLLDYLTEFRLSQGTQSSARFNTRSRENLILDNVKYPGPPVRIDFYQYPSDPDGNPRTTLEFAQPWACLKIFCLHAEPDKGKGYVKLDVKEKEGLGGVLYLQLEFCRERGSKCDMSLPKLGEWPSLER